MMGAGRAGATAYGVSVNMVQMGDKLQGLAPSATGFFIPSSKGGVNYYRTQSNGHRRDFVFCMNQLGGVGANKSQQKIRGLSSNVGGAKPCVPYKYNPASITHP
jgi:hypothetical protein